MARSIAKRALQHGHKPTQERMTRPLAIEGVGNGPQRCTWQINSPIAVKHAGDGEGHLHRIKAPIVEGSGEELPGLLGLRTLEEHRGILDSGARQLHFPGPGEVKIVLPPGSVAVDLLKAPSGHLVMPIDEFDTIPATTGGVPNRSLQLHTATAPVTNVSTEQPISDEPPVPENPEKTFNI